MFKFTIESHKPKRMLEDNISSIGELREHWEIHKQLLLENNLHEDIVELKAWFHENTAEGRIFNVTYLLENRDESFNTTLQKPEEEQEDV